MIYETIVTTAAPDGRPHIAPLGIRYEGDFVVLAPFRPSTTLENVMASHAAVVNFTTDVRIFAGCVAHCATDWPTLPASRVKSVRLAESLAHAELELADFHDDRERPWLTMKCVHREQHAPFAGFNRAQAAVVEGAILVSRLSMLPADKIDREIAYLQIAIDKTAGERERIAWGWLIAAVARHRERAAESAAHEPTQAPAAGANPGAHR